MTELEKMQRAKMYLDKLANGIDPLAERNIPEADLVNNVRISRCLFYVSDILRQVIENDGVIGKASKSKKQPKQLFSITAQELCRFSFSEKPIPVSEITRRINDLIDSDVMVKLKHTSITAVLLQGGFLTLMETSNGRTVKTPTAQGESVGISVEEREGPNGRYLTVVYNINAQHFILDNIDGIIAQNSLSTGQKTEKGKPAEKQGEAWTQNYDETLIDLFKKNVPVSEIAVTLKRSEGGVRARIKRLGLIEKRSDAI